MSSHANVTKYIDQKEVNKTYRPKSYVMSPGLKRAREPYRVRNIITGLALGGFGVAIWAWSIAAVKQDEFDDVDEEARRLARPSPTVAAIPQDTTTAPKTEVIIVDGKEVVASRVIPATPIPLPEKESTVQPRGVLYTLLGKRYPGMFDPKSRTLVWGAPEVDKIGSISRRS